MGTCFPSNRFTLRLSWVLCFLNYYSIYVKKVDVCLKFWIVEIQYFLWKCKLQCTCSCKYCLMMEFVWWGDCFCNLSFFFSHNKNAQGIRYGIRPMRRSDIPSVYALVAEMEWNIEISYLEFVFNIDPTGLVVVVKDDGELIGENHKN